jgi:hypothetical protein
VQDLPLYPLVWVYFKQTLGVAVVFFALIAIGQSLSYLHQSLLFYFNQMTGRDAIADSDGEAPRHSKADPLLLTVLFAPVAYFLLDEGGTSLAFTLAIVTSNLWTFLIALSMQPSRAVLDDFDNILLLRNKPIRANERTDAAIGSGERNAKDATRAKRLDLEVLREGELKEQLTMKIQHATGSQMAQFVVQGLLVAAIIAGSVGNTLPKRYSYSEWPVQRCPSPTMGFDESSCAGVDLAHGAPFTLSLSNISASWQNLQVTAVIQNREWEQHGVIAAKHLRQVVHVHRVDPVHGDRWVQWTIEKKDWAVRCPQGAPACDEALVMLRSGLPYTEVVLEFMLLEDVAGHGEPFIGETVIKTRHETEDYSRYELTLRYSMVALSLASLWHYISSFQLRVGRIRFHEWQPAQQAALLLIVANLCYNDPVFGFWLAEGEW